MVCGRAATAVGYRGRAGLPSVDGMRTRWLPVLGLVVLAPVCAEYLWGYDDSTGHPGTLLGNLIVFTPLYGAPALLIREVARRRGLGWPGILLLAAAFGVVEAAIVDQSMWSTRLPRHPLLAGHGGPDVPRADRAEHLPGRVVRRRTT